MNTGLSNRLRGAVRPRSKVWLEVDGRFAVGEGGGALLDAIRLKGSLRQAAADLGWSYRHSWNYLQRVESTLGVRLIATEPGQPRRGARLTDDGRALLAVLATLQDAVRTATERTFREKLSPAPSRRRSTRKRA